jgi:hypothetical protein
MNHADYCETYIDFTEYRLLCALLHSYPHFQFNFLISLSDLTIAVNGEKQSVTMEAGSIALCVF